MTFIFIYKKFHSVFILCFIEKKDKLWIEVCIFYFLFPLFLGIIWGNDTKKKSNLTVLVFEKLKDKVMI